MKFIDRYLSRQHRNNELHKFCREIDSYRNEGHSLRDAYEFVKKKYHIQNNKESPINKKLFGGKECRMERVV